MDAGERKRKVSSYIKSLKYGDKVKFCGRYGYTDTFYYRGKILGKAMFAGTYGGIPYPLGKWRKNILLPEEWE